MKRKFPMLLTLAAAGVLALQTLPVHAQDDAPPPPPNAEAGGGPGGPGGPGGDRNARRDEWRQRMADRIKTQMKATDEEWTVIQPLLEKVETKMRESMGRRFGGMMGGGRGGRRGGPGGGGDNNGGGGDNNRPTPPGMEATTALRTSLEGDPSTTEIKAKLQAVRDERKKSEAELTTAREDLKKVLNVRQEAVLVMMGVLE